MNDPKDADPESKLMAAAVSTENVLFGQIRSSGVRHKGSKEPRSQTSWFCFMKVS